MTTSRAHRFVNRYVLFSLLVASTLATGSFSPLRAENLRMPPHEKVVLKNGLTVLLLVKRGVPKVRLPTNDALHSYLNANLVEWLDWATVDSWLDQLAATLK